jgi:hypothetical protein
MRPIAQSASGVISPPSILMSDLPIGAATLPPSFAAVAAPVIAIAAIIAILFFIIGICVLIYVLKLYKYKFMQNCCKFTRKIIYMQYNNQ